MRPIPKAKNRSNVFVLFGLVWLVGFKRQNRQLYASVISPILSFSVVTVTLLRFALPAKRILVFTTT